MSFDKERLYELLPAYLRIRDLEARKRLGSEEGPLKELLAIVSEQISVLEENLDQLYDDQFIETCAEWVVPYLGDLIGTRLLHNLEKGNFSQRAEVANTIGYRRRKGTAVVLEQLAHDSTGWSANVAEYFLLLACTQYLNHIRPDNQFMVDLRNQELLDNIDGPFDKSTRSLEVRRIDTNHGKYNIPNVGIHLWRIGSYPVTYMSVYRVSDRRFKFDSLGRDLPLYNLPVTEKTITELATNANVPLQISRRLLKDKLNEYYGKDRSILIHEQETPLIPEEMSPPLDSLEDLITICNLQDTEDLTNWQNLPDDKIAIDPYLGRIAFPASQPAPENVRVSYYYGFCANIGGGEYVRGQSFDKTLQPVVKVPEDFNKIQDALDSLEGNGVVEVTENSYFIEDLNINLSENSKLEIRAADRIKPVLVVENQITVQGGTGSDLTFNGFVIHGGRLFIPNVSGNEIDSINIRHCTLVPGPLNRIDGVAAQTVQPRIVNELRNSKLTIDESVSGGIRAIDGSEISISDSIIDASDQTEVAFAGLDGLSAGAQLTATNTTIIGKIHTTLMNMVSNSILYAALLTGDTWTQPVITSRLQQGCIRFSHYPFRSLVPRAFKCYSMEGSAPVFTSLQYGNPGYCQLSERSREEIRKGADNGSEMGVYNQLMQPQREMNLKTRLKEYLRFGMEAGIFYAT